MSNTAGNRESLAPAWRAAWHPYGDRVNEAELYVGKRPYWDMRRGLAYMLFNEESAFRRRVIDLASTYGCPAGQELFCLEARARANLERLCLACALPGCGLKDAELRALGLDVDPAWFQSSDIRTFALPEGYRFEPVDDVTTSNAWIIDAEGAPVIGVIYRNSYTGHADQDVFLNPATN